MAPEATTGQPSSAWLLGVDFSCAPSSRKPIVAAWGRRHGAVVKLETLELITTLAGFEALISSTHPRSAQGWVGGFDFPFGLPRVFVDALRADSGLPLADATDLISHLRGMEIVVDMVGNASTHSEKNARLRGLAEVIQTAIKRATEFSYDFSWKHWGNYNDLFKSDFPMRDVMQQLHQKDAEIKRLEAALLGGDPHPSADDAKGDDIITLF